MELLIDFTMHKGIAKQLEAFRGIYIMLYFQARRYFLKDSRNPFTQWLRHGGRLSGKLVCVLLWSTFRDKAFTTIASVKLSSVIEMDHL